MALRYAVASGDWSNTATWNGGTLPVPGDDVYANTYTVAIDQNITVNKITTAGSGAASSGGTFTMAGNFTITANITAGTTDCLSMSSSGAVAIIGNLQGGSGATSRAVTFGGIGTLTLTGNLTGGSGGNSTALFITGIGTINVTGNLLGGAAGANGQGIYISGNCNLTINGNVTGGVADYGMEIAANCTVFVNGYSVGSSSVAYASGIQLTSLIASVIIQAGEYGSLANPFSGPVRFANTNPIIKVRKASGATAILQDLSEISGILPDIEDVREGTIFNLGGLTGILAVPPKSAVSLGVPTDDGFGEALLTAEDFLDAINDSANPIAERLRNVATVQTVASQLAAAL